MLGGILHEAGYFMGENLYPSRESNPKGFFENPEVNGINEEILKAYDGLATPYVKGSLRRTLSGLLGLNHRANPKQFQRWLAAIPPEITVTCDDPSVHERIRHAVERKPFAYKDPRFSFTLPVWRPYLDRETVLLCIFREPDVTVQSILKECSVMAYLRNVRIDAEIAYEVYVTNYAHALRRAEETGNRVLFLHYEQVFDGSVLPLLSERLGVELRRDFVEESLKRTKPSGNIPEHVRAIYRRLCEAAGYEHASAKKRPTAAKPQPS
ncbi:MAG: hypothetical protein AB1486_32585 [Planctomycetota bacterium]